MLQVLHLAAGRPRGNAARLGLAALAAFTVLTMSAGASDALATYGTVKVKKVNVGGPAGDWFGFDRSTDLGGGSFSLQGGGMWSKQVLANWAGGPHPGQVYTVTEPASDAYELKDLSCKTYGKYGPRPDAGTVTSLATGRATIKVRYNETVECVFTNERIKTGTIVVEKDLVPAADPGRFGLQVDGVTKVAGAGDGDASAPVKVRAGTHVVGETGTDLDGYARSTVCTKPGRYGTVEVASGGAGPLDVAVADGDAVTCRIKNVRRAKLIVEKHTAPADPAAPKTSFDFTVDPGAAAFSLTDGGVDSRLVEPGSPYTVTEADARAKGYKLTGVGCTTAYGDTARAIASAGSVATRSATVTPGPGDVVTCSFTNTKVNPAIAVQKTGPATAYAGDTLTFDYVVTNPGNEPLHQVDVTDDRCAAVVQGAKDGADDVLDPGETWRYSCTMVAPPHGIGDPNPVVNTATAEGLDGDGTKVQDHDTHATRFVHPAIDIEKTGPATATAGARLGYTLEVTNPGDMPFDEGAVVVIDARCGAAPARTSTNGDASPGSLDAGDRWSYVCDVQTQAGQTSVVNIADVTAMDENGRVVTDQDTFTTALTQPPTPVVTPAAGTPAVDTPAALAAPVAPAPAAQAQSAPAPTQSIKGVTTATSGTAALRGPRACPRTRVVSATVTGRQIRRVTFLVAGRKVRTVTRADARGQWTLRLKTSALRRGATRVDARVEFSTASQTRTRTLRIAIVRCAAQVVRPQFTG
ncbi:MAG: hypothetical protein QOJ21_3471 [Solirubrobacteraceae bacterium]|nr:hypothetical protein [Solirubrobacteraceae bacterium]